MKDGWEKIVQVLRNSANDAEARHDDSSDPSYDEMFLWSEYVECRALADWIEAHHRELPPLPRMEP